MRHRKDKAKTKAKIREKREDRFLAKHQSAFNQKLQTNYMVAADLKGSSFRLWRTTLVIRSKIS